MFRGSTLRIISWVLLTPVVLATAYMLLGFARENHFGRSSMVEGGQKQPPFYSDMSCSHIFCGKGWVFKK